MSNPVSIVLAVVALALAAPAAAQVQPGDMTLGRASAKVTVIEYASLACSHCARFHNEVFPAFRKKYVDTGKVRFVYREFLTQPSEVAAAAALTARCAGPRRYFDVIKAFYAGQAAMYASGDAGAALLKAGEAGGLKKARVEACLKDEAAKAALLARVKRYIETDGIESTPTFVIGGRKLEGVQSLEALDAVLVPLLAAR